MDSLTVLSLVVAALATVIATAYGLLPDRVDLMFVFAAYGAGGVIGGLIAARTDRDPLALGRRWGVLLMSLAAAVLALGLLGVIPS